MITESKSGIERRAAVHRALGEPTRLRIVDALHVSDRSPKDLADLVGVSTNLLAFHLNVLEDIGLVTRSPSQGDQRRRYVMLRADRLAGTLAPPPLDHPGDGVLFVCTGNSARSQLAAALWHARTGRPALSAGTRPAPRVHPLAVEVARSCGVDLEDAVPRGFDTLIESPDLVVSVCDRAHESALPFEVPSLHWSVPDPAAGGHDDFLQTLEDIDGRVDRLARALAPA
ncbi:arsenate reductase/protein-tyrosine-phosphatase family protein [Egicoccus halophilus]|uniref:Putative regulatory protein, ArsR family n=1 Tax=Egicoccus halophilus TaxID=1670830 RepID=A0A8J3AD07_9ACTN|nr:helix-turn-helix domain-containing protein [Egicoccus halophilus]GGI08973.1 putative regulatory protein, ArsR family [Egicoccus halophilus]